MNHWTWITAVDSASSFFLTKLSKLTMSSFCCRMKTLLQLLGVMLVWLRDNWVWRFGGSSLKNIRQFQVSANNCGMCTYWKFWTEFWFSRGWIWTSAVGSLPLRPRWGLGNVPFSPRGWYPFNITLSDSKCAMSPLSFLLNFLFWVASLLGSLVFGFCPMLDESTCLKKVNKNYITTFVIVN